MRRMVNTFCMPDSKFERSGWSKNHSGVVDGMLQDGQAMAMDFKSVKQRNSFFRPSWDRALRTCGLLDAMAMLHNRIGSSSTEFTPGRMGDNSIIACTGATRGISIHNISRFIVIPNTSLRRELSEWGSFKRQVIRTASSWLESMKMVQRWETAIHRAVLPFVADVPFLARRGVSAKSDPRGPYELPKLVAVDCASKHRQPVIHRS